MTNNPTPPLVCPKCHGPMRTYERNSVVIDQCTECRGVFLDRGELERLIDAEEQRYGVQTPLPPGLGYQDDSERRGGYDQRDYNQGHHGGSKHGDSKYGKRRRSGFLGELFD